MTRAVFLDRDGVLNRPVVRDGKPYPPATLAEFELLPGVGEACVMLKRAGFLLVVVTNQPDVGRGTQSRAVVEQMHAQLCQTLPIDTWPELYSLLGARFGADGTTHFRLPALPTGADGISYMMVMNGYYPARS